DLLRVTTYSDAHFVGNYVASFPGTMALQVPCVSSSVRQIVTITKSCGNDNVLYPSLPKSATSIEAIKCAHIPLMPVCLPNPSGNEDGKIEKQRSERDYVKQEPECCRK